MSVNYVKKIKLVFVSGIIFLGAVISGYYLAEKNNIDTLLIEERPLKNDDFGYLRFEEDINADDAKYVQNLINTYDYYRKDNKKVAYLTFDDGPSQFVTEKILDILYKNDVKATFFMVGNNIEKNSKSSDIIQRIIKEGHAIGNHTYSHDYDYLYPNGKVNVENFMNDVKKTESILKDIIGEDFKCRSIRMPGGSMSWDNGDIIDVMNNNDYASIDWNALNGDAQGKSKNPEELLNFLKETVSDKDTVVILMHDTDSKENTYNYMQSAIDYLKSEGFEFRTIK